MQKEGKISSDALDKLATLESVKQWATKWDEIRLAYDNSEISLEDYIAQVKKLNDDYPNVVEQLDDGTYALKKQVEKVNDLQLAWDNLTFKEKAGKIG